MKKNILLNHIQKTLTSNRTVGACHDMPLRESNTNDVFVQHTVGAQGLAPLRKTTCERRLFVNKGMAVQYFLTALVTICCISFAFAEENETATPIKHFIVLMQENHSFDNYFGTYPGADGLPENVCIPYNPHDGSTECVKPFRIGDNEVEMDDPDHSLDTATIQFNGGKMDGFVYALEQRNQDGRLAMGYYDSKDLPFHWNIADNYVLFDRFFSSAKGGSFINHLYWVAAIPDTANDLSMQEYLADKMTIFDRLQEKGVSWKFYIQNYESGLTYRTVQDYPPNRASQVTWVPLLTFDRFIDDPELSKHLVDLDTYYDDLTNGTLPEVAFMVPSGPSEHPPSSVRSGQRFIKTLIQALMQSKYWSSSVFTWSYDDWGGWYDHVPPPEVDAYGYGFRVPTLLVSAYAKQGYVDSTPLDYTSFLKFIEYNWDIEPLAERDANANNLLNAFDFSQAPRQAEFLPFERAVVTAKPEPKRYVIYVIYGVALSFVALLLIMANKQFDYRSVLLLEREEHA